jgi:ubiquitin-protein ligase E3 A
MNGRVVAVVSVHSYRYRSSMLTISRLRAESYVCLCSTRSPIDGLSKLGFVISKNGTDDDHLPSAHTCFNHLLLPEYSSREIMYQKLKYSITHAEGFGLR